MQNFGKKINSITRIVRLTQKTILALAVLHMLIPSVQADSTLTRSTSNPLLTPQNDELHVSNQYILKDDSLFKMWYTTHLSSGSVISYISSSDGINWEYSTKKTV